MLFAVPLFSSLLDVINVTLCLSVFAIPISGRVDDCLAMLSPSEAGWMTALLCYSHLRRGG